MFYNCFSLASFFENQLKKLCECNPFATHDQRHIVHHRLLCPSVKAARKERPTHGVSRDMRVAYTRVSFSLSETLYSTLRK